MGDHDHAVLTGRYGHVDDIYDDGRTLYYIEPGAGMGAGADHDAYHNPDAYSDQSVFRFTNEKLIPDTVHVRLRPFTVTRWESIYSTVFGHGTQPDLLSPSVDPGLAPSFEPVIDDSYRVIGHLGWIAGPQICLPKNTVEWDSPVAHIFEERRFGEQEARRLAEANKYRFPSFPSYSPPRPPPPPKPVPCRPAPAGPVFPDSAFDWNSRGPLKDPSEEARLQNNINYFVAGGGTVVVGRDYVYDQMPGQEFVPFLPGDYRCMALVDPDGNVQAILSIEKIHHESRNEKVLRIALEVLDIALTVWMIIDIFTISVVLLRAGVRLAARAEIRALQMAVAEGAKTAAKIAELEAKGIVLRGAMAGPKKVAEAALEKAAKEAVEFRLAANVAPGAFGKSQTEFWERTIAKRMRELGIPEKNIGTKVEKYKLTKAGGRGKKIGEAVLPEESGGAFNPKGTERGSNVRTFVVDGELHEGGISVHGNVFQKWKGFEIWDAAENGDRIDAIVAHEWLEFNGMTHEQAVLQFENSTLKISKKAKEILGYMKEQMIKELKLKKP
jgi:hypothetical protein